MEQLILAIVFLGMGIYGLIDSLNDLERRNAEKGKVTWTREF